MYKIRKTNRLDQVILLNSYIFPMDDLDVDEKTRAWLIHYEDKEVGFCTMRMLRDGIAYMDRGGILSDHRGKGLHKKLIKVRERYAKLQNCKCIITYVVQDNYASLFTLVRHGYKMYEPEYAYAGKGVIYLIKEI